MTWVHWSFYDLRIFATCLWRQKMMIFESPCGSWVCHVGSPKFYVLVALLVLVYHGHRSVGSSCWHVPDIVSMHFGLFEQCSRTCWESFALWVLHSDLFFSGESKSECSIPTLQDYKTLRTLLEPFLLDALPLGEVGEFGQFERSIDSALWRIRCVFWDSNISSPTKMPWCKTHRNLIPRHWHFVGQLLADSESKSLFCKWIWCLWRIPPHWGSKVDVKVLMMPRVTRKWRCYVSWCESEMIWISLVLKMTKTTRVTRWPECAGLVFFDLAPGVIFDGRWHWERCWNLVDTLYVSGCVDHLPIHPRTGKIFGCFSPKNQNSTPQVESLFSLES